MRSSTTYTDDRQTCTVDEAAAKLLGWMRSSKRLNLTTLTGNEFRTEELPHIPPLEGRLLDTLQSFFDTAEYDLAQAEKVGVDKNKIDEARERMARWKEQYEHAESFLSAIRRELAKEKKSQLKIDQHATSNGTGETHLTLDSLDQWAQVRYGVSIRADCTKPAIPREYLPDKPIPAHKGLSRVKADGLLLTFALLVEEYAASNSGYHTKKDKKPIVDAIAGHLAMRAKEANQSRLMHAQSKQSIEDRIEEALQLKRDG